METIKKIFNKMTHFQFSKLIIVFETILVAYTSYKIIEFTGIAIQNDFTGSLPYLTTFLGVLFAAYGVSVSFYYQKSGKENLAYISNAHELELAQLNTNIDCEPTIEE